MHLSTRAGCTMEARDRPSAKVVTTNRIINPYAPYIMSMSQKVTLGAGEKDLSLHVSNTSTRTGQHIQVVAAAGGMGGVNALASQSSNCGRHRGLNYQTSNTTSRKGVAWNPSLCCLGPAQVLRANETALCCTRMISQFSSLQSR